MNRLEDYDCITENEEAVKNMDWWATPFGRMAWEIDKERGLDKEDDEPCVVKQSA